MQRKVVCEEFKEHYINKPYGDVWHKMRELYTTSLPLDDDWERTKACEDASLQDVKDFFQTLHSIQRHTGSGR
jgi:hypothetical protein